jgi:hypothetical protein
LRFTGAAKSTAIPQKIVRPSACDCRGLGGVLWVPWQRHVDHGWGKVRSSKNTLRRLSGFGEGAAVVLWSQERAITRQSWGESPILGRPPHFRRLADVFHRITESLPAAQSGQKIVTTQNHFQNHFQHIPLRVVDRSLSGSCVRITRWGSGNRQSVARHGTRTPAPPLPSTRQLLTNRPR